MTLRSRMLAAFAGLVLLPLLILAAVIRVEVSRLLTHQHTERLHDLSDVIQGDLAERTRDVRRRLSGLGEGIDLDNRFRVGLSGGSETDRRYVLEYARTAMIRQGLAMLRIQRADGTILSSGHFPEEFGRRDASLPALLGSSPWGGALTRVRRREEYFLVQAAVDSVRLGEEVLMLIGGAPFDRDFLGRLVRGEDVAATLIFPDGSVLSSSRAFEARLLDAGVDISESDYFIAREEIPFITTGAGAAEHQGDAILWVTHPRAPLRDLRRRLDLWLAGVLIASALGTLGAAAALSIRITRPLDELARKATEIDLDHLSVGFASHRSDEVGVLSRVLDHMTARLRSSAERLREVERHATLGEVARQVNHDVKNGLTPLRNVFRHLAEVAETDPGRLEGVFRERRRVLEASITYLEALAANYAKISRHPDRVPCDLGEIAEQVASAAGVEVRIASDLAPISADRVGLRRIVENLVRNAAESLDADDGTVTVDVENGSDEGGEPGVRLVVSDTGKGIAPDTLARVFDDFYTTKKTGAGLGLSIVRRLVSDFDGTVRAQSEEGKGTRFTVWFPATKERHESHSDR